MTDSEHLEELAAIADRIAQESCHILVDLAALQNPACTGSVRDGYVSRLRMAVHNLGQLSNELSDGLRRLS